MKKCIEFLSLVILVIIMNSCAIYIAESDAVASSCKYNLAEDSLMWKDAPVSEQAKWLTMDNKLVNTEKSTVYDNDSLKIRREYIRIGDSSKVEYLSYEPTDYLHTIIFFIGNGSSQTMYMSVLAQMAKETNSRILSWNYKGYGKSDGEFSFKTQFDENRSVYEELKIKENVKSCTVIGYSLGSVFASDLAVAEEADKLVLLAPLSNAEDWLTYNKRRICSGIKFVMRPFFSLKVTDDYLRKISNMDNVAAFNNDLLILQAKDDKTLPYSMGKMLYKNSTSLHKKIVNPKEGDHGAPFEEQNWEEVISWLNLSMDNADLKKETGAGLN